MNLISNEAKWDPYFHSICVAVSSKSPCMSATGYNGPPRGIPHCGHDRLMKDKVLSTILHEHMGSTKLTIHPSEIKSTCPRRLLNIPSGEGMELCPAQHAETNCISNAARLGVSILGTVLYMNCLIPCEPCFGALINAGIEGIVVDSVKSYSKYTQYLMDNSDMKIREFKL